jgi:endonuclease/exonuclease/phosphatase family metal-dependent hydrolase
MKSHLDRKNSSIIDDEHWETASDHRAILVAFD